MNSSNRVREVGSKRALGNKAGKTLAGMTLAVASLLSQAEATPIQATSSSSAEVAEVFNPNNPLWLDMSGSGSFLEGGSSIGSVYDSVTNTELNSVPFKLGSVQSFGTGGGFDMTFTFDGIEFGLDLEPNPIPISNNTGWLLKAAGQPDVTFTAIEYNGSYTLFSSNVPAKFTSAIPEPGTAALLAAGLVGLGAAARRRNGTPAKPGETVIPPESGAAI